MWNARLKFSVASTLQQHLSDIAASTQDWHIYHQAGVLQSELAESFWYLKPSGWRDHYIKLQRDALDNLDKAKQFAPDETLCRVHITCDEILITARLSRERHGAKRRRPAHLVLPLQQLHKLHGNHPQDRPDAWHQTAVAYAIGAQLAWGEVLGYKGTTNRSYATDMYVEAARFFVAESTMSPDNENAYRSLLIQMALACAKDGSTKDQRHFARIAEHSARHYHDRRDYWRAAAIKRLGVKGEVLFRRFRDGRAISRWQ
jgi:hypothetical protein